MMKLTLALVSAVLVISAMAGPAPKPSERQKEVGDSAAAGVGDHKCPAGECICGPVAGWCSELCCEFEAAAERQKEVHAVGDRVGEQGHCPAGECVCNRAGVCNKVCCDKAAAPLKHDGCGTGYCQCNGGCHTCQSCH